MSSPDPRPDPTAALVELWRGYADDLDGLAGVTPAGTADRFRQAVLSPAASADPAAVTAAAMAWPEFVPDRLKLTTHPAPVELADLRDKLAALSREFDELPAAKSRLFGGATHPTIPLTPELRELIGASRRAFERLSRPLPARRRASSAPARQRRGSGRWRNMRFAPAAAAIIASRSPMPC